MRQDIILSAVTPPDSSGRDPGERANQSLLDRLWRLLGLGAAGTSRRRKVETAAFTMAFVGLAAKMAKADGVAVAREADAFERCFHVHPSELARIRRFYDLAAADVSGYEIYAAKIARLLADEPAMLRAVLESLFVVATADGVLHEREDQFLRVVARIFAIPPVEVVHMRHIFVLDPGNPYAVLGLTPSASDGELRQRYLALVRENHPDALMAHGLPHEFLALADRKLAAINAAYEDIRRTRVASAPA